MDLQIIQQRDVARFLALSDQDKDDLLTILLYQYLPPLKEMNEVQKTVYLATVLEDICQAEALPSLSEEKEVFLALPDIKAAHERLHAFQTAALLEDLISMVPAGTIPPWEWFFAEERWDAIHRIDSGITCYPDGPIRARCIAYLTVPQNAACLFQNLVQEA